MSNPTEHAPHNTQALYSDLEHALTAAFSEALAARDFVPALGCLGALEAVHDGDLTGAAECIARHGPEPMPDRSPSQHPAPDATAEVVPLNSCAAWNRARALMGLADSRPHGGDAA